MHSDPHCPFCHLKSREILAENTLALAFYDGYPVSDGHLLVIPRRHVSSYFDATAEEITAINTLLHRGQSLLLESRKPDGFNIGINIGKTAGQTIFHLHIHLIPRYAGDVAEPTGGVRHVIPGKGNYRD